MNSRVRCFTLLMSGSVIFLTGVFFEKGRESYSRNNQKNPNTVDKLQGVESTASSVTIVKPSQQPSNLVKANVRVTGDLVEEIRALLVAGAASYPAIEALGEYEAQRDLDAVLQALNSDELTWGVIAKDRFVRGVWKSVILQGWASVEKLTESDPELMARLKLDILVPLVLGRNDPERAIKYAKAYLKGSDYHDAFVSAVMVIVHSNIDEAKDYLSEMSPGSSRERVASAIASKIAKGDITMGLEWASSLPAIEDRQSALSRISSEWGDADPEGAAEFLRNTAKSPERDMMIRKVVVQWAGYDGEKAFEWLSEVDPTNSAARSSALQVWATFETGKALRYVSLNFKNEKDALIGRNEVINAYQNGIQRDPKTAAETVFLIEDERLRVILTQQIASKWMRQDPIAASTWTDSLKAGVEKDKGIEQVINGTSDSMEKLTWAVEIGDKKMRTKSFREIGSQILANNKLMDQVAEELSESQLSEFLEAVSDLKPENR